MAGLTTNAHHDPSPDIPALAEVPKEFGNLTPDRMDINSAISRVEMQKQTLEKFLFQEFQKAQRAVLHYAEQKKVIEADISRLYARKCVSLSILARTTNRN